MPTHQWLSDKFLKYLTCFLEADFIEARLFVSASVRVVLCSTLYVAKRSFMSYSVTYLVFQCLYNDYRLAIWTF